MTEIHLKDGSARNKGGDSMIRRGVTEDLAAVARIHVDAWKPVSYTHLDVYKRQEDIAEIVSC